MSHYNEQREAYQLETDYISDGTKPDLPDGTLVEYKTLLGGGVAKVENLNWDNINKVSSWRLYVHPDSQTHTKPHQNAQDELTTESRYQRQIISLHGTKSAVDVYRVLEAFEVDSHAIAHAIKKLLAPGKRHAKTREQDLKEAIKSIEAELLLMEQR